MATTMEYRYEALAQQSEALRVIFEGLPWGVIVADQQARLLFSNPAAESILGIGIVETLPNTRTSPEGWYLPDQTSVISPDQLPLVRAIRGEKVVDELIFVRNSPQRPGVWIRVNAWPLQDAAGAISGGVVMFHDFTRGRDALQSFVLLSRVVEQTADSVVADRHPRRHSICESSLRSDHRIPPRRSPGQDSTNPEVGSTRPGILPADVGPIHSGARL